MLLPGRLSDTTLGDLLGTLYRSQATGRLSLIDERGRKHDIILRDGLIYEVETNLGPRLGDLLEDADRFGPQAAQAELRLGEYLLKSGQVSQAHLSDALRRLHLLKLDRLFRLTEASIRFHVARPQAQNDVASPALRANDYLNGRPRRRREAVAPGRETGRSEALRVLGLSSDATPEEIRQAFRVLAQRCHPDRHPELSAVQRARLMLEFSQLSHAYHALVS